MAYLCITCGASTNYDIRPHYICPKCQQQQKEQSPQHEHEHHQQQHQHQHQNHHQQQHVPRLSRSNHHHRQQSEPAHFSHFQHPNHPIPELRHHLQHQQPPPVIARHTAAHNHLGHAHNRSASANLAAGMAACPPTTFSNGPLTGSRFYPSNATNSLWSDNEDTSKSQAKLAGSSFGIPYHCDPTMAEMSCDNVSNASRLVDPLPNSRYYLQAPADTADYMSLSQLVFNLISLIIYFCENTFGIIALIALYYHSAHKTLAIGGAIVVFISHLACLLVSFIWAYRIKLSECRQRREARNELGDEVSREPRSYGLSRNWLSESSSELDFRFILGILFEIVCHLTLVSLVARYLRLVVPVAGVTSVKRQNRELSILRLIHAFGQSIWLLIIQLYVIGSQLQPQISQASIPSAGLSFLSVCWALASFNKTPAAPAINWCAIASKLFWRFGTISSRAFSLTVYALAYGNLMLVVLAAHWVVMLIYFLAKPAVVIRQEDSVSGARRVSLAAVMAWIYCFCYVNFDQENSKHKIIIFYIIMIVQDNVLLTVTLINSGHNSFKSLSMVIIYLGCILGMIFMILYYKFFHPNILEDGLSACSQESFSSIEKQLSPASKKIAGIKPSSRYKSDDKMVSTHRYSDTLNPALSQSSQPEASTTLKSQYLRSNHNHSSQSGFFTCKSITESKHHKLHSSRRKN